MKNPFTERLEGVVSRLEITLLESQINCLEILVQSYESRFETDRADLREIRDLVSQVLDRREPSL